MLELKDKDAFECQIDKIIRPTLEAHDEVGALIPSLSGLKKWAVFYDPIIELYHHYRKDAHYPFASAKEHLNCPKLSEEDDLFVKSS